MFYAYSKSFTRYVNLSIISLVSGLRSMTDIAIYINA